MAEGKEPAEEGPPEGHAERPSAERDFRRRRPPSPQATRLMAMSAVAAIGLAVVLGVLFVPGLLELEQQPREPVYFLEGHTEDGTTRVTVVSASIPQPLAALDVALYVWDSEIPDELAEFHHGPLDPATPVGPVTFEDANANGILDEGDYFLVSVEPGTRYTLLILLADEPFDDPMDARGIAGFPWTA